jgi:hypothetical protein
MKEHRELTYRKKGGREVVIIETVNDSIQTIRDGHRTGFPAKIFHNMKNQKVIHDIKKWMEEKDMELVSDRHQYDTITAMEFVMGKYKNGKTRIR